jgi:cytochrome c oxidase assembly factor CtaG/putative copper export protein
MSEVALVRRCTPTRTLPEPDRHLGHWMAVGIPLVVAAVVTVTLVLSGGRPKPAPAGLPDAGAVTGWMLPLVRAMMDLGAVGAIGSLLTAAFLVRARNGHLGAVGVKALRVAAIWAWGWTVSAAAMVVLTTSDVLGITLSEVLRSPTALFYAWRLPEGRALVVMALVAFALALNVRTVRTRLGSVCALLAAILALVPSLQAGHSAAAGSHYVATQSLLVHVLAATLWVGGLLGLMLVVRGDRRMLSFAVPRFSALAMVCFIAVAVSGSVTAWARLGFSADSWRSAYGALVVVKMVALVGLGVMGLVHRRHTVARVVAGTPRAFLRLAVGEILLLSATVALAVVLSRTAPPVGSGLAPATAHGGDITTVDVSIDPLNATRLFTLWRPDALVVTAVVVALVGYLLAVRHVRRRGESWSTARVGFMTAGLGTVLFALCGGPGSYGSALLSMHAAQLLTMAFVAPILINLGAPVQLITSVAGSDVDPDHKPVSSARALSDPVNCATALMALLVAVYASPLLDLSLRNPLIHLLVNLAALTIGILMFRAVLVQDGATRARSRGDRAVTLQALAGLLVLFAFLVWRTEVGYGSTWFENLNLWWDDPASDHRTTALVMLGFAASLLALSIKLARKPLPAGAHAEGA